MNINSRIDWQAGMEITSRTFIQFDESVDYRQQVASRLMNGNLFGLVPFTEFHCRGGFVKNTLEVEPLSCMALLPSGKVLHVDEKVVVQIPMLYGSEYYLACGFSENKKAFDVETVPYVRPEYAYGIYSLSELAGTDLFPVMKFKVDDGVFSLDPDYIPPCLSISSDSRFLDFAQRFVEKLVVLGEHPNLEAGEGKRAFIRYSFMLRNYTQKSRVCDFIQLTREIAQAIDYYIVTPNTEKGIPIQEDNEYDVALWLEWLEGYMHGAATILDKVVLEDHSIDFDELKAQIKAELYERLRPELYDELYEALRKELTEKISQDLLSKLTDYINGRLKEDLHAILSGELSDSLYASLYKALYDSLYNALYVPTEEEEEEEFVPLI